MASISAIPGLLAALAQPAAAVQEADPSAALPDGVRAMIEAAVSGGDAKTIETVLRLARDTHPGAAGEIDEIEQRWRLRIAEAEEQQRNRKQAELLEAPFYEHWAGQVELGVTRSTGRSRYFGLHGSASLNREGVLWRHKLEARADLQQGRDVASTERWIASWQPNYKFGDRGYAYGLAQFEADPAQGYDRRYTAGGGLGYSLVRTERAKLELEGGPAFRHVEPLEGTSASSLAARGSINLQWNIAPTLELKQTSSVYVEQGNSSASALTMVDATLIGPLKARLSYDVRFEDSLATGGSLVDTLSRATLVYSF